MNRIADAFQNKKAFIAFITVGDPDLATTEKIVEAAVEGGADLIELGIPFSDPTAEGPVIMEADEVALRAGTTTDKVFELTKKLRATVTIPLVYMTYANVVFSYGCERFATQAQAAGVDGIILSDGAIVGSAIIKLIAKHGTDAAGPVKDYVKQMADAVHAL